MPLSASALATAIRNQLDTEFPLPNERGPDAADRQKLASAIANAVVEHITGSATVTGTCPPGTAGGPLVAGRVT